MCNYIFTYLSTVIFLLVKLIWRYRRDLRDYCTQFYTIKEYDSLVTHLSSFLRYFLFLAFHDKIDCLILY